MVVTEHEHRTGHRRGEIVEPVQLLDGDLPALVAGLRPCRAPRASRRRRRSRTARLRPPSTRRASRRGCRARGASARRAGRTRRGTPAYSSSVPRFVRSPLTSTTSGSSDSISAIAPRFIVSGYGFSPGSERSTGPSSSSITPWSWPHSVSPKCTSFTVASVASGLPAGTSSVVHRAGEELVDGRAVDLDRVLGAGIEAAEAREVVRAGRGLTSLVTDPGRRPSRPGRSRTSRRPRRADDRHHLRVANLDAHGSGAAAAAEAAGEPPLAA